MAREVDPDVADLANAACGHTVELAAAQERPHAADQLRHRERFRDVVVRAELEAEDAVELGVARAQQDDGDVALRAEGPADVGPEEARHHHVEDHDVELRRPRFLERVLAVTGDLDVEVLLLEAVADGVDHGDIVVGHQDAGNCGQTSLYVNLARPDLSEYVGSLTNQEGLLGAQAVALASDRLDHRRPELSTEVRDVDVARTLDADIRALPELLHDLVPRHDLSRPFGEQREQPKLGASERDALAAARDGVGREVDLELSEAADAAARAVARGRDGAESRERG